MYPETVDIDEHQGQRLLLAPGTGQRRLDPIAQQHAVGQAGQAVVMRQVRDRDLGLFALLERRQVGMGADAQHLAPLVALDDLAPVQDPL